MNTTNKYLSVDLEAKREAIAKAKPQLKEVRRSGKWRSDPDLITCLETLRRVSVHGEELFAWRFAFVLSLPGWHAG